MMFSSGSRYTAGSKHQDPVEFGRKGHQVRETRQEVQRSNNTNMLVAHGKLLHSVYYNTIVIIMNILMTDEFRRRGDKSKKYSVLLILSLYLVLRS